MPHSAQTTISIIGPGKIGRAVGQLWLGAGHRVRFGSRAERKLELPVNGRILHIHAERIEEAAAASEVIFLSIPYSAIEETADRLRPYADGKIVIDATNPFSLSPKGHIRSSLAPGIPAGLRMTAILSQSIIIRAFTHIMDELLVSRGTSQRGLWAMAIAGDSHEGKEVTAGLVRDAGFTPVDIGSLADSSPLDPGGRLFPNMFTEADMRAALTI